MGRKITADLVACAIVGAARAYGDDPIGAVTAKRGPARRCMAAAADGLAKATGVTWARAAKVVGIDPTNIKRAEVRAGFPEASAAAEAAVREGPMAMVFRNEASLDRAKGVAPPVAERVPMQIGSWDPKGSTATGYAWFVWLADNRTVFDDKRAPIILPIPPGTRARLTRPDDASRFGVKACAPLLDLMGGEA